MRTQLSRILRKLPTRNWETTTQRAIATHSEENILHSPYKSVPIPTQNVSDFCLSNFDRWTNLPALVCGATGKEFSYGDVKILTRKFGSQLLDNGLKPGDRIAVLVPNCPEFGPILFGATGVGVTVVPISPLLTPPEVAKVLAIADPKLIITCDPLIPLVDAAQKDFDIKLPVVTVSDSSTSSATPFMEFVANDGSLYESKPDFDVTTNLAILPFSSGTTGPPKGVMLTHQNLTSAMCLFNNLESGCGLPPLVPGDEQSVAISVIPMFHIFGLACNVMQPLTAGVQMVSLPKFEAATFINTLEKYKPTHMNIVPPLVTMLALSPAITRDKHLSRVKLVSSGGSPVSTQILNKLRDKMSPNQCELKEGYGMTEAPVVTRTRIDRPEEKLGSVGKIICNVSAKVVDLDSNKALGPNQSGELFIKGPHVMAGYFQNKEATEESFEDGWFRTGDVVYYDEEGYVYIVDRIKDMIKVKGYQVSPTELEDVIRTVPGVTDVAVIGIKDEKAGEVPKAFIVRASEDVNEEQIHQFLKDKLAKYKQLMGGIIFLQELPKSPTGKVLRKELRNIS
eukprot:GFUD01019904.1.p1 GENE.GFUD01019904.1~~GFUD01019904.1.p1  ORF type:complete len:566 (-),score=147.84 GFUD01019904.1:456-2153(-)